MNYTFQASYELKNEDLLNIKESIAEAVYEYLGDCFAIMPSYVSAETVIEIAKKALETKKED